MTTPTFPEFTQNAQATLDGNHVDVTWSPPLTGGPGITGYKVRAHLASGDTAVGQEEPCGASCTSVEFPTSGLTAGTAYKFRFTPSINRGTVLPP
jgi:hypothetical protein